MVYAGPMNKTCGVEITLSSDNEVETAYCGLPHAHAGEHGEWQR